MKIALAIFCLYSIVCTIESQEQEDKYNHCIEKGSVNVYTDMEAELLERQCSNQFVLKHRR